MKITEEQACKLIKIRNEFNKITPLFLNRKSGFILE